MPEIVLESDDLFFSHPTTADKKYSVGDPLEFLLELIKLGLVDAGGKPIESPDALEKLKARTQSAFGFPSLTFRQLIQIINAVGDYVTGLQKKTPSTPNSPPATASSPAIPANA